MTDEKDDLGVYYKCFRGANVHLAVTEPHSFAVHDAAGRDWVCYPVPLQVVQNLDMLSDLAEVERADKMTGEDTVVRLIFCYGTHELARKLADESASGEDEEWSE